MASRPRSSATRSSARPSSNGSERSSLPGGQSAFVVTTLKRSECKAKYLYGHGVSPSQACCSACRSAKKSTARAVTWKIASRSASLTSMWIAPRRPPCGQSAAAVVCFDGLCADVCRAAHWAGLHASIQSVHFGLDPRGRCRIARFFADLPEGCLRLKSSARRHSGVDEPHVERPEEGEGRSAEKHARYTRQRRTELQKWPM